MPGPMNINGNSGLASSFLGKATPAFIAGHGGSLSKVTPGMTQPLDGTKETMPPN